MWYLMARGVHGQIFCSHLIFFHEKKSLRPQTEIEEGAGAGPEKLKETLLHVFGVQEELLTYTKSTRVYDRDLCCKDLFHPSVSRKAIQLWRPGLIH